MAEDWQMYINDHALHDTISHDELSMDYVIWPHPALALCGTEMPVPDIHRTDLPKYSNPLRTERVWERRWSADCVPQPVTFLPPDGTPEYHAIPADDPYLYKEAGEKAIEIDCDDPLVLACDARVQYPKAPPVYGKKLPFDFMMDDRKRATSGPKGNRRLGHWMDRNVKNRLQHWEQSAPRITLDVTLEDLTADSRLGKAQTIADGHKRALHMQAHPEQYLVVDTSAIILDKNGKTLISLLGLDPIPVASLRLSLPNATDEEIYNEVRMRDQSHSPLLPEVMDDFVQKTKMALASQNYAVDSGMNSRHKPNNGQLPRHYGTYALSEDFIAELREKQLEQVHEGYSPAPFKTVFRESATTCHWMHAWHQNGHRHTTVMTPSADMWGNGRSGAGMNMRAYHYETAGVRGILRKVAEVTMTKEQFASYDEAYQAGTMFSDIDGIFLGQVVVSNCLSYTHIDGMDGPNAMCMTFSSYGHKGTMMIFPDLGVIARYDPTDLCCFRSSELMHFVSDWDPTEMQPTDIATPGRTAFVFFTPSATIRDLAGKKPGWFERTANGFYE